MMTPEKDLQLIDGYLLNKISAEERAEFEKRLNHDQQLRKELQFQQQLVNTIRHERALQLKQILNNVPVGATVNAAQTAVIKVIAGVLATGIVATGIYWYASSGDVSGSFRKATPANQQDKDLNKGSADSISKDKNSISLHESSAETTTGQSGSAEKSSRKSEANKASATTAQARLEETRIKEEEALKIVSSTFVTSSREVITDNTRSAFNFHYAFSGSRLVLYGSFEPNRYQILEFITKDNHIYILEYNRDYYLLDATAVNPTPLIPISDKNLIEKMRSLRK